MRQCSRCGKVKALEEYYQRKSGIREGQYYEKCRECSRHRRRQYYHQNRERQLSLAKKRKQIYIQERKDVLAHIKNKPCGDCGKIYPPWVMDFDHRDGKEKVGSVSNLTFRKLIKYAKIEEEIEKCDLVCANCHRERTYRRLHVSPSLPS